MILVALGMMFGLPAWEEVESPKEAELMAESANPDSFSADGKWSGETYSANQAKVEQEMETGMIE